MNAPAKPAESWFALATRKNVMRRALSFAVVVGAVLITINHGDAIFSGDVDRRRLLKMALTCTVPYVVSTLSSVGAMRQMQSERQMQAEQARKQSSALR